MSNYLREESSMVKALEDAGVDVALLTLHRVMSYGDVGVAEQAVVCVLYTARQGRYEVTVRVEDVRSCSFEQAAVAKLLAEMAVHGEVIDKRTVPGCCE